MRAFTLIELMLVIAMIGILALLAIPISSTFQAKNNLDIAAQTIMFDLRRAESAAASGLGDDTWGVKIQAGQATIFKGANYLGRDSNYDENTEIANNLILGGLDEVVFAKMTGRPLMSGVINLTSINGDTRSINISQIGLISD